MFVLIWDFGSKKNHSTFKHFPHLLTTEKLLLSYWGGGGMYIPVIYALCTRTFL